MKMKVSKLRFKFFTGKNWKAQTKPKYSFNTSRDLKESCRLLSKGTVLLRPLGHFGNKTFFSRIFARNDQKYDSKYKIIKKKILALQPVFLALKLN